jgi:hypothetical protein
VLVMTRSILAWAWLCASAAAGSEPGQATKKDVPLYTDEDLRRVSPLRDQTGGGMTGAAPAPAAAPDDGPRRAREEAYWRGEAERLRGRLEPLRQRAADLRERIEERRRAPGVRPYSDPRLESLQRRLSALEERIHEAEDRLHERARRAGAWPSWLR